jgi:hypothetical protein
MLASALDYHPDIQCHGEIDTPRYGWLGSVSGRVEGWITHLKAFNLGRPKRNIADADKVIVLVRDLSKRPEYDGEDNDLLSLTNLAGRVDHMIVDYEMITGGENIEEIPEPIARELCEFLGVDYHPLVPAFHKQVSIGERL